MTDRVDVYSFAILAYELLRGQPAWGYGTNFDSLLLDVANKRKRPALFSACDSCPTVCSSNGYLAPAPGITGYSSDTLDRDTAEKEEEEEEEVIRAEGEMLRDHQ